MMPLSLSNWTSSAVRLLSTLSDRARSVRLHRVGPALVTTALMGTVTLASAGYVTTPPVGGPGGGTLQLANTAINPTLGSGAPSSTNPPTASYSNGSPAMSAYLGYRLDFTNSNTVVPVSGTITLSYSVTSLNAAPLPTYNSVVLPAGWTMGTCTVTNFGGGYSRTCPITLSSTGTINPGATKSVVIFLNSPTAVASSTSGTACPTTTTSATGQCVRLAASATYNSTATTNGANEEILLGVPGTFTAGTTFSNRALKAYTAVRPAGGTLFTGYDSVTTSGQFYAKVVVPSISTSFVTSAKLEETTNNGCNAGSAFYLCSRVDVTVPGAGLLSSFNPQYLQIQLRIDSSAIINPSAAGQTNTVLYYQSASGAISTIPNCSSSTTPLNVGSGPCIASRGSWSTKNPDYIFNLISFTNGGYYFK